MFYKSARIELFITNTQILNFVAEHIFKIRRLFGEIYILFFLLEINSLCVLFSTNVHQYQSQIIFLRTETRFCTALFGNQDKICSEKKTYFSQQTIIFTLINWSSRIYNLKYQNNIMLQKYKGKKNLRWLISYIFLTKYP